MGRARREAMGSSLSPAGSLVFFLTVVFLPSAVKRVEAQDGGGVERSADRVDWLPNGPEYADFDQYSGYFSMGREPDDAEFFYYFVESVAEDPTSKPLILYLGCQQTLCSPVAAAFQQVGPYLVDTDGQSLLERPSSWNKMANILFLDTPVIVGFSFTQAQAFLVNMTDISMAMYTQRLLNLWFKRFPAYRNCDLYIAGQSDIGVTAPLLALRLLHQNKRRRNPPINLKGLIMGNPDLDKNTATVSMADYSWHVGLMSTPTYLAYRKDCVNYTGSEDSHYDMRNYTAPACLSLWFPVELMLRYFDPYSLYATPCPDIDPNNIQGPDSFLEFLYTCHDEYVSGYLSIPFIQRAMHVRSPPYWTDPPIFMPTKGATDWTRIVTSSLDVLQRVVDKGVRVLIYSGIYDYTTPSIGTERALASMNLTMDTQWRPWFGKSPIEFAGYTTSSKDGLTFATVRNAGRKSSYDQPENVYTMVDSFINNKPLPKSSYFPDP